MKTKKMLFNILLCSILMLLVSVPFLLGFSVKVDASELGMPIYTTIAPKTKDYDETFVQKAWMDIAEEKAKIVEEIKRDPALPNEYIQLDNIMSTGTQYIDTGYVPKTTTKIEIEVAFSGEFNNDQTNKAFFGSNSTSNKDNFGCNFGENQPKTVYIWVNPYVTNIYSLSITQADIVGKKMTFTLASQEASCIVKNGGSYVYKNYPAKEKDNVNSLVLFGFNKDDGVHVFNAYNMTLFSCKLYESNVLIHSYVPAQNQDGKVGLFDLVEQTFLENTGDGVFTENNAYCDVLDTKFYGKGLSNNPYLIQSAEDYALFTYYSNQQALTERYFELTSDIILNDGTLGKTEVLDENGEVKDVVLNYNDGGDGVLYSFTPILYICKSLKTNGFKIIGVYIEDTTSGQALYKTASVPQETHVKNSFIKGGDDTAGLIVKAGSALQNCSYDGTVVSTGRGAGICGTNSNVLQKNLTNYADVYCFSGPAGGISRGAYVSPIENCKNYGNIYNYSKGREPKTAGIAVFTQGLVKNCKNYGQVYLGYSSNTNYAPVGGISATSYAGVENCENYGKIISLSPTCGGIVGNAAQQSYIKDCENYGKISSTRGLVGGILGSYSTKERKEIQNCINYADVRGSGSSVGGLVGALVEQIIYNCDNYGTIVQTGGQNVGGLCGSSGVNTIVSYSNNYGKVLGSVNYVGGLVGFCNGQLLRCINNADVVSTKDYVGGLVGINKGKISLSVNNGRIEGLNYVGGLVGRNDNAVSTCANYGQIKATNWGCLIGWNYGNITECVSHGKVKSTQKENIFFGNTTEGFEANNIIAYAKFDDGDVKKYFGDDFSAFYCSWRTEVIGLNDLEANSLFKNEVTENFLKNNEYTKYELY